jgi:transposase-like protein
VFGMVERGKGLTTYVVPNAKINHLFPSIEKYVAKGCIISADEAQGDRTLYKIGYGHDSMNHGRVVWVKGKTRTQRIEGIWPHINCSTRGTHRSISTQRLQRYLVEFELRFNFRRDSTSAMFVRPILAF